MNLYRRIVYTSMNANKIKEGELTLLTFCTMYVVMVRQKYRDQDKKNPTKGVSNPRNPTSRSADVSGFTFLSPNVFTG